MSDSCPKCGSAIELASRPVTVRTGKCTSCEANITYLEGTEEIPIPSGGHAVGAALEVESGDEAGEDGEEETTLKCSNCGGDLELSIGAGNSIEATCTECQNEQRYVLEGMAAARPPARDDEGGRRPWGRSERSGPGGPAGPPARPCRECGGALKFTTLPDGMVQGECTSCGNKFVLPPRRDDRRGGDRGRGGYGGRSNYRSGGGGGRYGGRGGGGGGGYRGKRRDYGGERSERPRRRSDRDE